MLPLRSIAFLIGFFSLSAASFVVPALGIVNYMLIYQVYPEHTWWYPPIEPLGIRFSMTAAICMMLGYVVTLPRMHAVRPLLNTWDILATLLVVVVIVGEFVGIVPSPTSQYLTDKFVKMMAFIFFMTRITTTRRNYMLVMWAIVLGTLYIGYDAWTAPRGAFEYGRLQRVGGPDFRHSSGLAAHMVTVIPLVAATFMAGRSWLPRLICLLAGALSVNTVVLCRTRSAFVGLALALATALVLAPKTRRLRTWACIGAGVLGAYALTDSPFWERMATLEDPKLLHKDAAATGRLEIWKAARVMIQQNPWGVGVGNFQYQIGDINPVLRQRAAHNTFILCAAELGLPGLLIFVALLFTCVVQTWQCYRRAAWTAEPIWTRYMAYGLILSLAGSFGTQLFTERLYTEAFWWTLALPGCLKRVVARETERVRAGTQEVLHGADSYTDNVNSGPAADHARPALA